MDLITDDIWPYNPYTAIFNERIRRFKALLADPVLQKGAKVYYKDRPVEFIMDWCITYDPRNTTSNLLPTTLPFILFPRQVDLVEFLVGCLNDVVCGLVEKSRDMGATWVCCAFSVWLFLFHPGAAIGWGSRKEIFVDQLGNPDSIFEKIRIILRYIPTFLLPLGFNYDKHCNYMKVVNPETGSTITGEVGKDIGRGGRKLIYFKDESAHYEQPERIEAALGDNTNIQIDFSSVNGPNNIFYRRRMSGYVWTPGDTEIPKGVTRVFILDWRDHPLKTQEWYDSRLQKAEREGLVTLFRQEVDRDYSSAVAGTLIQGHWVKAAIDAHKRLGFEAEGKEYAALDPFDEGGDAHSFIARKGSVVTFADQWYVGDTGEATRRSIVHCKLLKIKSFQYDCIGVGAGVKSETNRLLEADLLPKNLHIQKWNASKGVLYPEKHIIEGDKESPINKDFFKNLKAQGWWSIRNRFEKTYKMINKGEIFDYNELISIPSDLPFLDQLVNELSQPTYAPDGTGKIVINKKPPGTRSPNLADACVMAMFPADSHKKVLTW